MEIRNLIQINFFPRIFQNFHPGWEKNNCNYPNDPKGSHHCPTQNWNSNFSSQNVNKNREACVSCRFILINYWFYWAIYGDNHDIKEATSDWKKINIFYSENHFVTFKLIQWVTDYWELCLSFILLENMEGSL